MTKYTLILAHGAGAPMDSDWMNAITEKLETAGVKVIRFEFPYMDKRRTTGKKSPPDRLPILIDTFNEIVNAQKGAVFIAGKSMGGRIASIIAPDNDKVSGVIAFGYPFHPPGKPEKLRTEHLKTYKKPMLIVQGENDPFGKLGEWNGFEIDKSIEVFPITTGNHDLKPNKSSGMDLNMALDKAVEKTVSFIKSNG
ncbi:MAG: alpha/beta family hydrolase [Alphaproteobacteria bacterium]